MEKITIKPLKTKKNKKCLLKICPGFKENKRQAQKPYIYLFTLSGQVKHSTIHNGLQLKTLHISGQA